jgi:hypothetical protein
MRQRDLLAVFSSSTMSWGYTRHDRLTLAFELEESFKNTSRYIHFMAHVPVKFTISFDANSSGGRTCQR